jgi:hypothetical protein
MTNRFKSASESGRSRPLIVALDQYLFAYFVRLSPNGEDVRLETDCHSTGRCRCGTEHIRSGGVSYVGVPLSPRRLCLARRERQPPDAARADPLAAVGKPERLTWLADAAVASLEVNAMPLLTLRYIGGVIPSRPTTTTVASQVPSACFSQRGIKTCAPAFKSALSPGTRLTITASVGTTIVFLAFLVFHL